MSHAPALVAALLAFPVLAGDLTIRIGETIPLPATVRVVIRDPALLELQSNGGGFAVLGKEEGVTGINVYRANGERERLLVTVTAGPVVQSGISVRPAPAKKTTPARDDAARSAERALAEAHGALGRLTF